MIELPEGNSLGWMQAPSSWISSHTVRFVGIVRVVIQDGEGFILIKKGKPLFHYFKHGSIELKGHSARDYFNSHPIIEFNLCKYSTEEFALALKACNIEENEPPVPKEPESSGPVPGKANPPLHPTDAPVATPVRNIKIPDSVTVSPEIPAVEVRPVIPHPPDAPVATPVRSIKIPDPVTVSPEIPAVEVRAVVPQPTDVPVATPVRSIKIPDPVTVSPEIPAVEARPVVPHPTDVPVATPVRNIKIPDPVTVSPEIPAVEVRAVVPQPVTCDERDLTIISQIKDLNGIVAISIFNDTRNVIMMGDANKETMLKIAGTMLETAQKVTPLLTWGPFVHLTLQIPEGNMIIAPYHDNYLCLLTTRTINIGHIRRILRDLQQKETTHQES